MILETEEIERAAALRRRTGLGPLSFFSYNRKLRSLL